MGRRCTCSIAQLNNRCAVRMAFYRGRPHEVPGLRESLEHKPYSFNLHVGTLSWKRKHHENACKGSCTADRCPRGALLNSSAGSGISLANFPGGQRCALYSSHEEIALA